MRPSRAAAPLSVIVFTNMPNFSRPASAPTPIPIILRPKPSGPFISSTGKTCIFSTRFSSSYSAEAATGLTNSLNYAWVLLKHRATILAHRHRDVYGLIEYYC
uniref:Uncharacterized protein n=1 Tax=Glossina austeni TaxID=7395 RepID=A0A1A9VN63_GLOAU